MRVDGAAPAGRLVSTRLRHGGDRRSTERRREPRAQKDRRQRQRRLGKAGLLLAAAALFGHAPSLSLQPQALRAPQQVATAEAPRSPYDRFIEEASALYGVSAGLVRAVIQVESNFDPLAVSPAGAKGLMQLAPITARTLGIANPFDPRQNILGGVRYLSMMLDRHDGNVPLALASYNAGPNAVRRHRGMPPYKETRGYVKKVLAGAQEQERPAAAD